LEELFDDHGTITNIIEGARMRNLLAARMRFTSVVFALLIGCAADRQTRDSLNAGYSALGQQQYDQAISIADQQLQASQSGAGTAEAFYLKGRALELRPAANPAAAQQSMTAARDAYFQGLQAVQSQRNPQLEARLHGGVANTAYWLADYVTAQSEWTKAYDGLEDPNAKSYALYRIGVCQQRLGQFNSADQTFAMVQQQFPSTDAAGKAKQHQGVRGFTVQLATFASSTSADTAASKLRSQGAAPARSVDAAGHSIVSVGPFQNYSQAEAARSRFASVYPDAMILP
jgi:tetratricopeptide (TPR) repeat protein